MSCLSRKFCMFRSMPSYHTTVFILFTTSVHTQCSGGHVILGQLLDRYWRRSCQDITRASYYSNHDYTGNYDYMYTGNYSNRLPLLHMLVFGYTHFSLDTRKIKTNILRDLWTIWTYISTYLTYLTWPFKVIFLPWKVTVTRSNKLGSTFQKKNCRSLLREEKIPFL